MNAPTGKVLRSYGVTRDRDGKYACYCSCGWIETGWPNQGVAIRSLTGHTLGNCPARAAVVREGTPPE